MVFPALIVGVKIFEPFGLSFANVTLVLIVIFWSIYSPLFAVVSSFTNTVRFKSTLL